MKYLSSTLMILLFSMVTVIANPENAPEKTITFRVNGEAACEDQIKALLNGVHGISSLTWDAITQDATVTFNPEEIKEDLSMFTLRKKVLTRRS